MQLAFFILVMMVPLMCIYFWARRIGKTTYPVNIPAIERWAETHCPEEKRAIAAGMMTILISQTGLPLEEITPASSFLKDIGYEEDFDTVRFVMALEERFGVGFADKDAEQLRTLGDVVDYIHEKLETATGSS